MPASLPAPVSSRRRFAPGFGRLVSANTMSGLGDGIRIIALSVYAATVTDDPVQVSLVTVAGELPWLLVGPFAGTLIDHVDRWRALWICDAARSLVLACFTALVLADRVGIAALAVTAFLLTSVETMADNLAQAVIPQMVGTRSLDTANSRVLSGRLITMEFLGPPVGTALFALAHLLPFGVATVCFAVSTVLVFGVRPAGAASGDKSAGRLSPRLLGAQTAQGVRWLWRHRLLRTVCLLMALLNFAVLAVLGIAVLYAMHTLGVGETVYGLLLLVIAAGGLLGLVIAPKVVAVAGRGRSLQLVFAMSPLPFVVAAMTSNALVAACALVFVGIAVSISNVITTTLRQELVPEESFGRVNGAYRLVLNGLAPLGGLTGGFVADQAGLRAPFLLAAALLAVAALASFRLLSNRAVEPFTDRPAATSAPDPASPTSTETADQ
ncbi:MFS transporter [Streptomyces muensis]|uniref:MFS transporter n=1 Tax=Streptomyces muensis TaxID=1077944 RepID=A0A9X1TM81_STRM4|nr:MFS transporter [Streptomyces muensis]MCF1597266.1 MFS transporter [Streptomyces muensis]